MKKQHFNIISWNVNGIRSRIINDKTPANKKPIIMDPSSNFYQMTQKYQPQIICLQETRCAQEVFDRIYEPDSTDGPFFPYRYINPSTNTERGRGSGYSGTAMFSSIKPLDIIFGLPNLDTQNYEGRVITAEFDNFFLINVYTPNSGTNEEYRTNIWDKTMLNWIKELKNKKPVVLVGDMNVCSEELDVHSGFPTNPNERIAGLLPEEREGFHAYLNYGMIDSFRKFCKTGNAYTWWNPKIKTFREANKGWRIDYCLVDNLLEKNIKSSIIMSEVMGSDHCPVMLTMEF